MADETKQIIENWLDDVQKAKCSMSLDQIEDIVYRLQTATLKTSQGGEDFEEKENSVFTETGKQKKIEVIDQDIKFIDECEAGPKETSAKYYKTVKDLGKEEFWKLNAKSNQIKSRLEPQKFQHHMLQEGYLSENKEKYQFKINTKCPASATDSEMENYNLMRKRSIKENALTYRFSRQSRTDPDKIEYLCRMCPFKRWVPVEKFREHMCLAHGILHVKGVGYVGLPPPDAVYRQSPGKLKCYYCKCPKCLRWIRLGKITGVGKVSRKLRLQDNINNDQAVAGLYTNYFHHFILCSRTEESL